MNVWFVGSGVYAIFLFFALALCRVATRHDTDACTARPSSTNIDYEELLDLDGVRIDAVANRPADDDILARGSRPGAGSRRSRQPRMVPARQRQFIQR